MASSAIIPNSDITLGRDGAGDRVVVFVHGWTDDLHVWSPVPAKTTAAEIEKSSHWPHIEQPAVVAAWISRFLASNLATEAVGK